MSFSKKAFIKHVVSYYPENVEENAPEARITAKIGVFKRPTVLQDECASDLAVKACENLFSKYSYDRSKIDAIIFCTQTPDYFLPATACVVHGRLGLKTSSMAFDVNQGCTGYIYGLSLSKALIESGQAQEVLLITADTLSKIIHPRDMRTKPLFGDAAAATIVSSENSDKEFLSNFKFGTNGADYRKIIINYGCMRMKYTSPEVANQEVADAHGNIRTDATIYMDGKSVVQFTQSVVPQLMNDILADANLKMADVTNFIFHQANRFMLENLQKVCEIPDDGRYFNDCSDIGNTSSASIANAINNMQSKNIALGGKALLMGFGVGLSWGGCIADLSKVE